MPRYVAFLKGMNLGKRRLTMSHLAGLFEELGYKDVKTFIASGNVLFDATDARASRLEGVISAHLEDRLGYAVDVFIRSPREVIRVAAEKIFPDDGAEGATIHVGFVHEKFGAETKEKLEAIRTAVDEFKVRDREYYWLCRTRTSESKVWSTPEARALRLPTSTLRNMTSIRKLVKQHLSDGQPLEA